MFTGNNKFEISDTILKLEELLDQGRHREGRICIGGLSR